MHIERLVYFQRCGGAESLILGYSSVSNIIFKEAIIEKKKKKVLLGFALSIFIAQKLNYG